MMYRRDFLVLSRPLLLFVLGVLPGFGLCLQAAGPEPVGWYSGDMHVHRSCGGAPVSVSSIYNTMVSMDLSVISLLADMGNGEVQNPATDLPLVTGQDASVSTAGRIVHWDAEWHWDATYTQYPYQALGGHIVALGLTNASQIWNEMTYPIFDWARRQGAIAGFVHMQFLDDTFPQTLTCCTPVDYPVEVALGACDFISEDVTGGDGFIRAYYRLLNCGFRPGIAAGSDYPCGADIGAWLTYSQCAGNQLTYHNWLQGIKNGRTVVSRSGRSEFVELKVNGTNSPGDEINLTGGGNVQVSVQWTATQTLSGTLELVRDGVVVASQSATASAGAPVTLNTAVNFTNSGWLCARRMGSSGHAVHTAAVFVTVDQKPVRASVADAQFFVDWMEQLIQRTSVGGAWASYFTTQRAEVQARYQAAKSLFQQITIEAATNQPVAIATSSLPDGFLDLAYSAALTASGGFTPYVWSLVDGALPAGLTLNTSSGVISGTPATLETANVTVRVTDAGNPAQTATQALSILIDIAPPPGLIGNTNNGSLKDNLWYNGAWVNACRFQASSNLTVTEISAKVVAISGHYKCAIYTESNGQPSRLLGSTVEVANSGDGWRAFPLASPVALAQGVYYWLAIWSDDPNAKVYYSDNGGTLASERYNYGPWPDPMNKSWDSDFNFCIYAYGTTGPGQSVTITTSSLPNGLLNQAYSATLVASGGFTPYSWSLVSGALPAGLTLNTNSGVIAGVPATPGTANFAVRVTDSGNPSQSATQALSILVGVAPAPGLIGNTNNGSLTDIIWYNGDWINACRFQALSNITVTGLEAKVVAISGHYKCAIYTDNDGQPSRLLGSTLEVSNPADGWQTFPLTSFLVLTNGAYYWLAIWSDAVNAEVYYSDTGGMLRAGLLEYGAWPDPVILGSNGNHNYCIYAHGTSGPVATNLAVEVLEDTSASLTLLGGGGDTVSYAILTNPTNGILGSLDTSTGAVSYTPSTNYFGADSFVFAVSSVGQQATGTVSVTVSSVNDAPTLTLTSNNVVVLEDSGDVSLAGFAAASVGPVNELAQGITSIAVLSVSNATIFGSGPAISPGGALTFTTAGNSEGVAEVTVQAVDDGGTANGGANESGAISFTITIAAVNDAPVAVSQRVTNGEDESFEITLTGSDVDGPEVNCVVLEGPTNGILSGVAPDLVYRGTSNYYGPDSFTFSVNDGSLTSEVATVTILLTNLNDAPVAFDQSVTNGEDESFEITLTGSDVDGPEVNYVVLEGPTNGILSGVAPDLVYRGTSNYYGPDSFTFTVNDGSLTSEVATVTIQLTNLNDAPVVTDEVYLLGDGVVLEISAPGVLINDGDSEGGSLTAILVNGPLQGELDFNPSGGFTYTPTNHFSGVDSFTYQASDGQAYSGPATVSIAVSNPIQVSSVAVSNEEVIVKWNAIAGRIYRLEYKDNWAEVDWTDSLSDVLASGATAFQTNAVGTAGQRFYRVKCLGDLGEN
ncbi:MAG TPA: tandem-95 repeat protein [Candidatus Paceibacterota bacterium]|nr:tandem-95 repeat protein [Verrucomicrobiota bacterium]HSA10059.1 tandem-95 repeat protein [Candidatus Paceibacterota bacterium]